MFALPPLPGSRWCFMPLPSRPGRIRSPLLRCKPTFCDALDGPGASSLGLCRAALVPLLAIRLPFRGESAPTMACIAAHSTRRAPCAFTIPSRPTTAALPTNPRDSKGSTTFLRHGPCAAGNRSWPPLGRGRFMPSPPAMPKPGTCAARDPLQHSSRQGIPLLGQYPMALPRSPWCWWWVNSASKKMPLPCADFLQPSQPSSPYYLRATMPLPEPKTTWIAPAIRNSTSSMPERRLWWSTPSTSSESSSS